MTKAFALLAFGLCMACDAGATGLDAEGNPIPLAEYVVVNGKIQGNVDPDHMDQWARFDALIPYKYRTEITLFQPIDSDAAGGIDGSMAPIDDARSKWLMMLDTTGAVSDADLDRTMVHEFAHLLTLRTSQVPNGDSFCTSTLSIAEGCPLENSYLDAFAEKFGPPSRSGLDPLEFNVSDFVTEYAATNVIEDIAESFAEWVVFPSRWTGNSIADQKVQFFDQYPELVQIKADIRNDL